MILACLKKNLNVDKIRKSKIKRALKECVYGDINAKQYVKDFIGDLLINTYNLDDENILKAINFSNPKSIEYPR